MSESNGNGAVDRRQAILAQSGSLAEEAAQLGAVDVIVRELTGKQAREWEEAVTSGRSSAPLGHLLQLSLLDPDTHELLFEVADRESLEALGIATLKPVIKLTQALSGITDSDIEKAKRNLLSGRSSG